ncbi:39S ribosomal protein L28, mitochondrial [Belonocnema kinseyi]|uniref:39S ribosomal protein L28, mitochondrial n=1 Tax=Belonocnema kinseyi TaxID=2817044 RepID=UPI00143DDC3A|nr:39S ribosomal protein L28, mitochondrial [Belonocnema kinseyi]
MASSAARQALGKSMYYVKRPSKWDKGYGAYLPQAYRKFFIEWRVKKPEAVHYIENKNRYWRDENTGLVYPVQNRPLPLKFPKEQDEGLWGGEAVIQGFTKKDRYHRRVPRFWFPALQKSVVYSKVLDKYLRVTISDRTLQLIHANYGFDHYILKTPACDLRSKLAVKLKRQILTALADKTLYPDDPVKREEVYDDYKQYLSAYTREEIEWYGLTFEEACEKWKKENVSTKKTVPLKIELRAKLIEELKAARGSELPTIEDTETSLLSKIKSLNPFSSSSKTD